MFLYSILIPLLLVLTEMANSRVENCIFCNLIAADDPDVIIHKSDLYVVIKDIRPVATYHFLVLSRKHIESSKSLKPCEKDRNLLENMVEAAKQILLDNGRDLNDTRMGFHWPPFYSIGHMHLHAINPVNSMSVINRFVAFNPSLSFVFVDVDYVRKRIGCDDKKKSEDLHKVYQGEL